MTVRQEAYVWIDRLPEDSVRAIVQIMRKMAPAEEYASHGPDEISQATPKMRAYLRMQELRSETAAYKLSDAERARALDRKYDRFFNAEA